MRCTQVEVSKSYARAGTAVGGGVAYGRCQYSNQEFVQQRWAEMTYDVGTQCIVSSFLAWTFILLDESNSITGSLGYWRGADGSLNPGSFLEQGKYSELYEPSFSSLTVFV